jgi:hypothetical protein
MARTILRDAHRLGRLAEELKALQAAIDNEENVPERFESTLAGELADADAELLSLATRSVTRLARWARFEAHVTERYTRLLPQSAA